MSDLLQSVRRNGRLLFGAAALLQFCAGASVLSRQFIFGEGHEARPIIPVLLLFLIAWLGFALAFVGVWRTRSFDSTGLLMFILGVGVVARLVMATSGLIQENDCYRYVLDGEAVLAGVNPFRFTPEDVDRDAPAPFFDALQGEDAQLILSRISYEEIPTIYPPLAQAAFAAGAWLTPWSWHGQRIVFLLADLFTMFGLVLLLRRVGVPAVWVLLYAWNPLIIKEVVNSAHVEGVLGPCLVLLMLGLVDWSRGKHQFTVLLWIAAGLSGAVLTKLYPVMLSPIVAACVWRGSRRIGDVVALAALCAALCVVAYAPFLDVGLDRLTEGLRTFSGTWVRNAGIHELLSLATPYARGLSTLIPAVTSLAFACLVLGARDSLDMTLRGLRMTLLVWFLTLPMVFPWYAYGLLVVTVCAPRFWAVILSGMFGLYYLVFFFDYHDSAEGWYIALRWVEHGVVIAAVVAEVVWLCVVRQTRVHVPSAR